MRTSIIPDFTCSRVRENVANAVPSSHRPLSDESGYTFRMRSRVRENVAAMILPGFWRGLLLALLLGSTAHAQPGVREIHAPLTITNPGSYKLVRNISHGVTPVVVAANDVTIDLNGFRLGSAGFFPPYGPAILQQPGFRNLTIRNGSLFSADSHGLQAPGRGTVVESVNVSGCPRTAILAGDDARIVGAVIMSNAVSVSAAIVQAGAGSQLEQLVMIGNTITTGAVVSVGPSSILRDVALHNNQITGASGQGIRAGAGTILERITVQGHQAPAGSFTGIQSLGGDGLTLASVAVFSNTAQQIAYGIDLAGGANVRGVLSGRNTSTSANPGIGILTRGPARLTAVLATRNTGNEGVGWRAEAGGRGVAVIGAANSHFGFHAISGAALDACLAATNGWRGFNLAANNRVENSLAADNGEEGGFRTTGNGNVIAENHAVRNARGFVINGSQNLAHGNSASANTSANYVVGGGNNVGAISIKPGYLFNSTNPWTNFDL